MRLPEIHIPQQTTNFPPKTKNFNKHIFTFVHIQFRSHSEGKRVKKLPPNGRRKDILWRRSAIM